MNWRVPNIDLRNVVISGVTYRVTRPAWVSGYRPATTYTPVRPAHA